MPTFESVEITTTADIEFEVTCGTCGAGLCMSSSVDNRTARFASSIPSVSVEACARCLETAKEEGDQEGYDRGFADGVAHDD